MDRAVLLQVLLENDVVPIKPPRNCTAELAARVAELQALGTYESTAGESEVARYTWEQSEQLQCESEVATELSQNKLERDMDDLMSGSTVASHIAMESSDDPYSVCIMEQPCVETWTQFPEYTVAVIVSALVLFLCFVEVTSMFIYGQDAGHMTPRSPRLVRIFRPPPTHRTQFATAELCSAAHPLLFSLNQR